MVKLLRALPFVLLACAGFGAFALFGDVGGAWKLAVLVPLAVVAALRLGLPRLAVAGVIVVPVFALLGADALWARLGGERIGNPIASLLAGAVILGLAALAYLRPWLTKHKIVHPERWAAATAAVLVLLPVAGFWLIGEIRGDGNRLEPDIDVVSTLDVIVLRDGAGKPAPQPEPERGWDVRTWSGAIDGDKVAWDADAPPALPAAGADRILLLEPSDDDTARWLRVADRVTPRSTPTFALLAPGDPARVAAWKRVLDTAGRPGERYGDARVLEAPASTTDIALRLAVDAPTSDEDLALAAQHQPELLFDSAEKYATPLNIDQLLKSGKLRLCEPGQALRTLCREVHGSGDLRNGGTSLAFDPSDLTGLKDSSIYVNVTRSGNDGGNSIYLDYWWYLAYNPAGAARGAFCGAGFVIAGATCFDHQSDWEGVTVVLDGADPQGRPKAVSYAQHEGATRYTWRALRELWRRSGDARRFGRGVDLEYRPLVFVAQGTHAAYARSCAHEHCDRNGVPDGGAEQSLKENRYDGGKPWRPGCPASCVIALPTHGNGAQPARWNAYSGPWGSANCVLRVVCTSAQPPSSPANQHRYRAPWCYGAAFDFKDGRFRPLPESCGKRMPTVEQRVRGGALLALGDSYSSGQGGGTYEPGTTGGGNTCYRSANAWPERLASLMHLQARTSLACSGAVVRDVVDGSSRGEQERRLSQIGRIEGDPAVITLTIGGNDIGFADVLKDCVLADCVKRYHKPSGDLLEAEITTLERRLPDVYRDIRAKAPNARVIVTGYPRPFPRTDAAHPVGNCAAGDRISAREADYLNARLVSLNAAIERAAKQAGVTYVDVTEAFDGAELRCSGPTFINRLRLSEQLMPASFHPNAAGYQRLADVVAERLGGELAPAASSTATLSP